jgi:valyl-tRNA synthetase
VPRERANEFELVREAVSAIRQVRAEYAIAPGKPVEAVMVASSDGGGSRNAGGSVRRVLDEESPLIGRLTRSSITIATAAPREAAAHVLLSGGAEVVIPLAGLVDVGKECQKLRTELEQLVKQLGGLEARLANPNFVSRAKPDVVQAERAKQAEWSARRDQLSRKVQTLCGA